MRVDFTRGKKKTLMQKHQGSLTTKEGALPFPPTSAVMHFLDMPTTDMRTTQRATSRMPSSKATSNGV